MKSLKFSTAFFILTLCSVICACFFSACKGENHQSFELKTSDCKDSYNHLKLSPDIALRYITGYEEYLDNIKVDDSKPGTPDLNYFKVKSFLLPKCELEAIVNELGDGLEAWATIGIKDENLSMILKVRNSPTASYEYFDFSSPCPHLCDDIQDQPLISRSIECNGDYQHLKLSEQDATEYISNYKDYLNAIEISYTSDEAASLENMKFESFKISECELESIVKELGPGLVVWAVIGIKNNEPTLIFKVRNATMENWTYFDFNFPCPNTCN
jgi:hypothetical protein